MHGHGAPRWTCPSPTQVASVYRAVRAEVVDMGLPVIEGPVPAFVIATLNGAGAGLQLLAAGGGCDGR